MMDKSYKNLIFQRAYSFFSLAELQILEVTFLEMIDYRLDIDPELLLAFAKKCAQQNSNSSRIQDCSAESQMDERQAV